MTILNINQIYVGYDLVNVLHGISIEVKAGEITCILGANGAGKTTLIRAITGLNKVRQGNINWHGQDITGLPAHQIVKQGISCIPEGRKIFPKLTVTENLLLGGFLENNHRLIRQRMDHVLSLFPRLAERTNQLAGTMSGGEQAMVSIGRGLMAEPKLLVIDEPSLGLSPLYVQENFRIIESINRAGIAVLLVEQNAKQTLKISHRGYCLSQGKVVAHGTATELLNNDEVKSAYFS
ncbi:MAG: ABC transporter ATP-binding protein [Ferrovum sp. 37-45-19]|jgi:branched-chain amino acid transport system ATP-binding protein|uniref:ABC transporter ATP-binding protein n=1 Tax=Ferrovum sp. JA12 TaxID=1356299 RepID=UPI00070260BF|nr:ABC transporter ATP-binding protein [Ferrovum sp. JA12]OYV79434.1 MAG: ABC transporter ATP-binding protein [Ferrovum sp. 21-44-67]OYV94987.1 MAG: ABC transporter ATP-binding protein [Ferrovum sp. 37-45-19]OZB34231.1 MAG: ABC transporter ATP-binding protein [Ferrovum sp. 34-44-207]HQT80958.1 ABC transporter ATP-binding protein [Ferrovaceae bacterium]KRH78799.1 high-affinity branched-chain amino acid transport ATP-binding protein LivF [Ferrovum sp. JA12]